MLSSREQILRDIRAHLPAADALPNRNFAPTVYANATAQYLEVLGSVGGAGKVVHGTDSLRVELERLAAELNAQHICSVIPEALSGDIDLNATDDPHDLANVDLAVLPGELAVAENGAVWVTGDLVRQRVAYFLSQHVALVVPADRVVNNMHEAYDWLYRQAEPSGPFATLRWGTFMSGPSKTADIEQALVIGAHGARSLHVFLAS